MKIKALAVLGLVAASKSYGIWGVGDISYDPTVHGSVLAMEASTLAKWAQAIKQYEDMILNQMKLIESQNALKAQVGDWKGVYDRAMSIKLRAEYLKKNHGLSYSNILSLDYGDAPLTWDGNGRYSKIATTTAYGNSVAIDPKKLRTFGINEKQADNIRESFVVSDREIEAILDEIAKTAEQLGNAKTQADSNTYSAKLQTLRISLENERAKRRDKFDRLMMDLQMDQSVREKERIIQMEVSDQQRRESLARDSKLKTGGQRY